jgi:Programmed cell death protein 7
LSEVRRKQNEAKRLLELLESLKELRQLRAASVKSRHGLFAMEEQNVHFATVTEKASQLMKNQLALYEKEEETLKAMMAHQGQEVTDEIK